METKEYNKIYYEKNKKRILKRVKEYYQKNKGKILQQTKEYWKKNKDKINKRKKEYHQNNKEKEKEYYQTNKEKILKKQKDFYQENKEYYKEYNKDYYQKNKDKIKERHRNYYQGNKEKRNKNERERYQIPNINIHCRLKAQIRQAIRTYTRLGKIMTSKKYGIDYKAIIEHLKPFPENLSDFEIDHINPLCNFNFINKDGSTNIKEIEIAFAPENHQWLTVQENRSKGGSYGNKFTKFTNKPN